MRQPRHHTRTIQEIVQPISSAKYRKILIVGLVCATLSSVSVACRYDSAMMRSGNVYLTPATWTRITGNMKPSSRRSEVCMLLPIGYNPAHGMVGELVLTGQSIPRSLRVTGRWIRSDGAIIPADGWSLSQRRHDSTMREQACLMLPFHESAIYTAVEFRSSDSLTVTALEWDSHGVFGL
jgi:hypothetical protein